MAHNFVKQKIQHNYTHYLVLATAFSYDVLHLAGFVLGHKPEEHVGILVPPPVLVPHGRYAKENGRQNSHNYQEDVHEENAIVAAF